MEYCRKRESSEGLDITVLTGISKSIRVRAAIVLVALYGFCLLIPAAALAFGDGAAHCLTDEQSSASSVHVHADGTAHVHATDSQQDSDGTADPGGHTRSCCGVACVSAIAPVVQIDLADQVRFTALTVLIADAVPGRAPERLYRPPISH